MSLQQYLPIIYSVVNVHTYLIVILRVFDKTMKEEDFLEKTSTSILDAHCNNLH